MVDCVKGILGRIALRRLKRAKLNAYRISIGLEPIQSWSLDRTFSSFFRRVCCFCLQWKVEVRGTKYTALDFILLSGTLPNKIVKSMIGFLCGLACIYIIQMTLKEQLAMTPSKAWYTSMVIGILLGLGLAFSQSVRFYGLLIIPQIFTQQVRIVLLSCALSLAMSGPGTNYVHNMEILTISLHCSLDMLNEAFKDLMDIVKNPVSVIAKFFKILKNDIESIFDDFKKTFSIVKKTIVDVVDAVKEAFRWLKEITEMCNAEFGTPYSRCKIEFKEAVLDCIDKVGDAMSFMCHVDALDDLCELTKVVDFLCILPTLIKENIFQPIEKELDKMLDSIKDFFDARIHTAYHLNIDLNSSKTARQILRDMKEEVLQELDWILKYFTDANVLVVIAFVLTTFGSAVSYRYWYLNLDRHDNKYVTKGMIRMDMERERLGRQTIFPLKFNEAQLYVQVISLKMLKTEKKKFKRNLLLVLLSSVPVLCYIFLDLGLYFLLILIKENGAIVTDLKDTFGMVNVTGEGFMVDIDRAVLKALKPLHDALPALDNRKCLPKPREPNYWRYSLISFLLLFCIFLVCTEAYGLRLRHLICGLYYPDRQLYRDRWLYVHILSSRGSFFQYARSQLMSKLTGDDNMFRVSLRDRLIHTCPGGRKLFWFLETTQKKCFLCGRNGDMEDYVNFHHCPTCKSVYCHDCFQEVANMCPICRNTMDFDVDIDEESGSHSDEDEENIGDDVRLPLLPMKKISSEKRWTEQTSSNKNEDQESLSDLSDDSKSSLLTGNNGFSVNKSFQKRRLPPNVLTRQEGPGPRYELLKDDYLLEEESEESSDSELMELDSNKEASSNETRLGENWDEESTGSTLDEEVDEISSDNQPTQNQSLVEKQFNLNFSDEESSIASSMRTISSQNSQNSIHTNNNNDGDASDSDTEENSTIKSATPSASSSPDTIQLSSLTFDEDEVTLSGGSFQETSKQTKLQHYLTKAVDKPLKPHHYFDGRVDKIMLNKRYDLVLSEMSNSYDEFIDNNNNNDDGNTTVSSSDRKIEDETNVSTKGVSQSNNILSYQLPTTTKCTTTTRCVQCEELLNKQFEETAPPGDDLDVVNSQGICHCFHHQGVNHEFFHKYDMVLQEMFKPNQKLTSNDDS